MKKLTRSRTNRWIAGVCGGVGEYLDIDPNIIRAVYIIFTVLTRFAAGLIIYILLWIIIPDGAEESPAEAPPADA
ncbi:PspC domain-containing protein [Methanoculleus receptaculi]|jgi:phage shock protein C|uniref:PspC domain-containing protein n=1 Tax=Methanoculleus receptaculi TaxID=394967 RepID=A0AAX4FTM7_9EURY|nr:PspC domain-containing protein [Methanoculleus receptaculi]WOX57120.1 PspC domain-containing protein [Methanoculleus receptaculi]